MLVYRDDVKKAVNGDMVECVETDAVSRNNLTNGTITEVIKRAKDIFVGGFVKADDGYNVILHSQKVNKKVILQILPGALPAPHIKLELSHVVL